MCVDVYPFVYVRRVGSEHYVMCIKNSPFAPSQIVLSTCMVTGLRPNDCLWVFVVY